MNGQDSKNYINSGNPEDFSIEEILAEYLSEDRPKADLAAVKDRAEQLLEESIGETGMRESISSLEDFLADALAELPGDPETAEEPELAAEPETPESMAEPEAAQMPVSEEPETYGIGEILLDAMELPGESPAKAEEPPVSAEAEIPAEPEGSELMPEPEEPRSPVPNQPETYGIGEILLDEMDLSEENGTEVSSAAEGAPETGAAVRRRRTDAPAGQEKKKSAKERFLSPILAGLALIAVYRAKNQKAESRKPTVEDDDASVPEPEPEKAVRLYSVQAVSLKRRGNLALILSLVMIYLSFAFRSALPLTGALKHGTGVISLLLAVFEMSVIVTGLDIFTNGWTSLFRKRPGAESLVSVSCTLSLLDSMIIGLSADPAFGLPFCAISALSMTAALYGEYFACRGIRTGFRILCSKKRLYTVTSELGITEREVALMKSRLSTEGFMHRTEEADFSEYIYEILTPVLLVLSVPLALVAAIIGKRLPVFFHSLSMMTAAAAAFSCTLGFSMPFCTAARRLYMSGAALAGWSGVRDIGKSRHVIITDTDVFPHGTVELAGVRILEGAFTDKVISYTAAVVLASGSGLSETFSDLVRRNGYTVSKAELFKPHDGGGLTAMINGENVCVGSTGFMNLVGIRVPRKLSTAGSLYTAINGQLVGIFNIKYKATASVQDALALLLHSNLEPVFALRDFNITPSMLKRKFRLPTDGFNFPPYADRFRISGAEPGESSHVAAVLSREGMGPLVDAAERGRRLYSGIRACTLISAVGSAIGLVIMFLLCLSGSYDSASVTNVMTFMLIWLIPGIAVAFGLRR